MRSAALFAFLAGCTCGTPTTDAEAPIVVRVVGGTNASKLSQVDLPVDPATLFPAIFGSGPYHTAPTSLVIDLARPAWAELNKATIDGITLEITPPVEGGLVWTTPSQLRFTPNSPLLPDTDYTATLSTLTTRSGVLTLTKPVVEKIHTPPFALVDVRLAEARAGDSAQRLEAVFSGAVDAGSVMKALMVSVAGMSLAPRELSQPSPHVVRFEVKSSALGRAEELAVALQDGIARSVGSEATAPAVDLQIPLGKAAEHPVDLLDVVAREGTAGFVVDVICKDDAAAGEGHYWWDDELANGWWLSSRCELDAASITDRIHVSPPLTFDVVPSGSGFRLRGDFQRGAYAIRIDAGADSVDGGVVRKPLEAELIVPARAPTVRFASKGRYMPRGAWGTLPVEHRNVSDARLTLRHVPRRNLLFWMSGDNEDADERTSELISDSHTPLRAELDKTLTTWLDLTTAVPKPEPGVWEITVEADGARDVSRVLVTDMQLIAKAGDPIDGARTYEGWVADMNDNHSIDAVALELVRASGQVVARCTTAVDGHCTLTMPKDLDPAPPVAIIATRGDDLTYLRFADVQIANSENLVGGESWQRSVAWRAAVWTDRGVYRPGEVAHIGAILRDQTVSPPKPDMPVHVDIVDPRGRTWKRVAVVPNAAGLATLDLTLGDYATTGRYEAVVRVGDDAIGRQSFMVEEFVPERLAVTAIVEGGERTLADPVSVSVSARYLFGGSAAGSRVEVSCRLLPTPFAPKRNGQLAFGRASLDDKETPRAVDLGSASGTLADDGSAIVACPAPAVGVGVGDTATLTADVAVFEAGSGRATHNTATVLLHPAAVYVGLVRTTQKADAGKPITVTGQLVDWSGTPTSGVNEVTVETFLLQSEWDWSWDEATGEQSLRRWRRPSPDGTTTVAVRDGKFTANVTPSSSADGFLVRVTAGEASSDLVLDMQGWHGWWYGAESVDQTPRPLAPQQLRVSVPPLVHVGNTIETKFTAPFDGRALITVETDRVVEQRWMAVKEGPVRWTFSLGDFVPNVYVGVLILKDPHAESADSWLPDRAWGVSSVRVAPEAYTLPVKLTVPDQVKPGDTLTVSVDLGPLASPGSVVVSAVDEGVLSLTRFETPDPVAALFPPKSLGVQTYETTGWGVARPPGGPSMRTGGDAAARPTRVTMVKPVALWSGVVPVDASGKATVSFTIPSYRGRLRVMAVAATPKRTGSAEASVTVREPIVLQTTLPRFLVQGDEAQIPVFVTNTSGAAQTVKLELTAEDLSVGGLAAGTERPIAFTGASEAEFSLEDGASHTAVFRVRALASVGAARFNVVATAGKLVSRESLDIPFVSTAPRVRRDTKLTLTDGSVPLASSLTGWIPTTETTSVWVTSNPYAASLTHLSHLLHYPYGCVEQTSSQTRALVYLADIAPAVAPELGGRKAVDAMVRSGLDRVLSMQTASGGFGYWPGDTNPTPWATAYATHMLMDARDAGQSVPSEAIADAVNWLRDHLTEAATYQNWNGWRYEAAYEHYVLARAGRLDKAAARALLDPLTKDNNPSAVEARYLVRAALYIAGDRRDEALLRTPDTHPLLPTRHNDATYWSDLRARGLQLSVYQDLFGKDDQGGGEPLARIVADGLSRNKSGWYTTQELVWGLTGLGKRAGPGSATATLALRDGTDANDGETLAAGLVDMRWTISRASERPKLTLDVSGLTGGKLYAMITSTGSRADARWEYGGRTLALARSWRDSSGRPVDLARVKLGDVVYAVTTLSNTTRDDVANVALVDRLPAGWEIESARIGPDDGLSWVDADKLWSLDHLDARDDRIEAFGTVPGNTSRIVVVALRAVTAGTFSMAPVEAEAMYDPTVWARAQGATVTISGPWDAFWL